MDIELQVCSKEQAKKLKELGVIQTESYFIWGIGLYLSSHYLKDREHNVLNPDLDFASFTVAELGVMLPPYTKSEYRTKIGVHVCSLWHKDVEVWFLGTTEADARADCLIWLLEKGLQTAGECSEALLAGKDL